MKICILSCFPDLTLKDTGGSVRVYYLAKGLAELGHKVHVVIPGDRGIFEWANRLMIHSIKGVCPIGVLTFFSNLLGASRSTPLFFYDFFFISRACHAILESNIVQIEQPWAGALMIPLITKIFRKPLIVDSHDAFQALRIRHTGILRRFLETSLEKMAYRLASVILAVSERDRKVLVKHGIKQSKIVVVPNGVDTEAFTPFLGMTDSKDRPDSKDFHKVVFVGNMEYFPNREAVRVIASSLAAKIQSKINNVEFLIIGRVPQEFRTSLNNLTFTGVVENVSEFLGASDVAIAPLLHGSGTRLKILEYFSCGLPVVSTSIGIEGLEVRNGKNVLVEDNMDTFAAKVIVLLQDRMLSMKLGKAARSLVIDKYDWKKIGKQLDRVYHNMYNRFQIDSEP